MRRLLALIRNLPGEASVRVWTHAALVVAPKPEPEPPKKVDYDALRALGGNVISIPKKAAG